MMMVLVRAQFAHPHFMMMAMMTALVMAMLLLLLMMMTMTMTMMMMMVTVKAQLSRPHFVLELTSAAPLGQGGSRHKGSEFHALITAAIAAQSRCQ